MHNVVLSSSKWRTQYLLASIASTTLRAERMSFVSTEWEKDSDCVEFRELLIEMITINIKQQTFHEVVVRCRPRVESPE